VKLERPVTVYVLYATAVAGTDGGVRFYPDLYGRDAALERAIGARPRREAAPRIHADARGYCRSSCPPQMNADRRR
jgi:hypothetical protein